MPYAADSIWVQVSTSGLADFTLGAALPGYRSFTDAAVPNGSVIHYSARTATEFENGEGTYNSSTGVVSRTTIFASSNANAKVNFGSPPQLAVGPLAEDVILVGQHMMSWPAGAWKAKATGGASAVTYADLNAFSFNGSTASRVRFHTVMPKSWNEGTIQFRVTGVVDTGGASGNVAVFKMAAKAFSHDDPAPTSADLSTGAQAVNLNWTADDDILQSAFSAALTIDGTPAENDLVVFELWRDPADAADNNTAAFILLNCSILYTVNAGTDG